MLAATLLFCTATATAWVVPANDQGVQSMLDEEAPDVFLAKATLQQYLSRVVRKDWDDARRLQVARRLPRRRQEGGHGAA